jgi:hypothetical protein
VGDFWAGSSGIIAAYHPLEEANDTKPDSARDVLTAIASEVPFDPDDLILADGQHSHSST